MTIITVNGGQIWDLPPGSELTYPHETAFGNWFIDRRGALFYARNGQPYVVSELRMRARRSDLPFEQETYDEFVQRFATICRGQARANSIDSGAVIPALEQINANIRAPLTPGSWIHRHDSDYVSDLPDSATIAHGVASVWASYCVVDRSWRHVLGGRREMTYGRIEGAPHIEGTEEDARRIHEFGLRAWEVGLQAKGRFGWCSVFESTLAAMRIDASLSQRDPSGAPAVPVPEGMGPGEWFNARDRHGALSHLPENTLMLFAPDRGQWNVTVRRNTSRHPGRTIHLFGPNGGSHGGSRNTILYNPDNGPMAIPFPGQVQEEWVDDFMARMPVGSIIGCRGNRDPSVAPRLVKYDDGWGNPQTSRVDSILNRPGVTGPFHILHIPGINTL